MYKWGLAPLPNWECGANDQTADHVTSTCLIHREPQRVMVRRFWMTILDADLIPPQPAYNNLGFSPPDKKDDKLHFVEWGLILD